MALMQSQAPQLGSLAPAFSLPGVDGKLYSLDSTGGSFAGAKALVVVFMCNHCPYVIAVQDRINELAREYAPRGVALIGINPNDAVKYPDDCFEAMKERAREKGYVFPYVRDDTQDVARAYGAVCTPDFFVYVNGGAGRFPLKYAGRLDDNWKDPAQVTRREVAQALDAILSGREPSGEQRPSMGCSIKWK